MEFKTLSAMLATQASDGQVVTVRDSRQSYIYLKNRPDLSIDNVNVFETPVSSDRWVAEKAIPTWDESAIVSALGYTPEDAAQKGEADGYAPLDENAKVPLANMPATVFTYKGAWNASTNSPSLSDGSGVSGDTYRVSVAGSRDFGSGSIDFEVGDKAVYNGSTWEKWDTQDMTVPAGTVIEFAGAAAPTGYLACDGASLLRADYAALFSAIGTTHGAADGTHFNVPDMRGLFVRGAGAHGTMTKAAGGAFDGGSVGATDNDKTQGMKYRTPTEILYGSPGSGGGYTSGGYANWASIDLAAVSDGTNGTPRTGNETKPASISLLYCIKT